MGRVLDTSSYSSLSFFKTLYLLGGAEGIAISRNVIDIIVNRLYLVAYMNLYQRACNSNMTSFSIREACSELYAADIRVRAKSEPYFSNEIVKETCSFVTSLKPASVVPGKIDRGVECTLALLIAGSFCPQIIADAVDGLGISVKANWNAAYPVVTAFNP